MVDSISTSFTTFCRPSHILIRLLHRKLHYISAYTKRSLSLNTHTHTLVGTATRAYTLNQTSLHSRFCVVFSLSLWCGSPFDPAWCFPRHSPFVQEQSGAHYLCGLCNPSQQRVSRNTHLLHTQKAAPWSKLTIYWVMCQRFERHGTSLIKYIAQGMCHECPGYAAQFWHVCRVEDGGTSGAQKSFCAISTS